jgi:hypothetical protein
MQHQHVWHCWSLFRIILSGTESWAASSESSFYLVAMERRVEIPLLRCNASGHPYIPTLLTCNQKHTHTRGNQNRIFTCHPIISEDKLIIEHLPYLRRFLSFSRHFQRTNWIFSKALWTPETKEKRKQKTREEDDELVQKIKRKLFKPLPPPPFTSKQTLYLLQFLSVWNDFKNCGSAN